MDDKAREGQRSRRKAVSTAESAPTSVPGAGQPGKTETVESLKATAPASTDLVPAAQALASAPNDRAWKIAQLAATLASSVQISERSTGSSHLEPRIASPAMDPYYAAAMKRAEIMLDWSEGKWGCLHAYQLFSEGEISTEDEILAVFNRSGWANLKSKQPIIDLMREIRQRFEEDLQRHETLDELGSGWPVVDLVQALEKSIDDTFKRWLGDHDQVDAYTKSVRKEVRSLLKTRISGLETKLPEITVSRFLDVLDGAVPELKQKGEADLEMVRRFVAELKSALAEQTQGLFPSGGGLERLYAHIQRTKFFDWCFPQAVATRQAKRVYRPYEIFLCCAEKNWFREKLVADSSTLRMDSMPGPALNLRSPVYGVFVQSLGD